MTSSPDSLSVHVETLPAFFDNYMYVIRWGHEAAAVDPAEDDRVLAYLRETGLALKTLLNTHHHADHVSGNLALKKATGCTIVGPDDPRIPGCERAVGEGDEIQLGPLAVRVLATPGHGSKDVSFFAEPVPGATGGMLWSGDTLFAGGCGRLMECTPAEMWDSLCKLAALPDDTLVYCGHEYTLENLEFAAQVQPGYPPVQERLAEVRRLRRRDQATVPSTVRLEKATNPFLRASTPEMRVALGLPGVSDVEVFAELRRRKDRF